MRALFGQLAVVAMLQKLLEDQGWENYDRWRMPPSAGRWVRLPDPHEAANWEMGRRPDYVGKLEPVLVEMERYEFEVNALWRPAVYLGADVEHRRLVWYTK